MTSRQKIQPHERLRYPFFSRIGTRWMDNDVYGHINNVVYYSWFDTVVNSFLIQQGALDIHNGSQIGLVVESQCNYFTPLSYPQTIDAGLRVGHLGRSSVRYEIGLFAPDAMVASAQGYLVHVYVDRSTRRPVSLPSHFLSLLEPLQ